MTSGDGSFCGIFKRLESDADGFDGADFVLLGVPYDACSSYRPGSRLGPKAVRELATSINSCDERGKDLSDLAAVDAGDLVLPGEAPRAYELIEEAVGRITDAGAVPIVLGGDHSITVPAFTAVAKRRPGLHLLYLDAHPDLYPELDGDPYSHGCVVHRILRLEDVAGDRITQVGIRSTNPAQRAVAESSGVRTVFAWEADDFACDVSGPVYLSVDIDVLDPAYAPGCGNPVPGGLSTRQLLDLIHGLATSGAEIVGVDVVEVNPLLDTSGVTALAAVRVVTEVLSVLARSFKDANT